MPQGTLFSIKQKQRMGYFWITLPKFGKVVLRLLTTAALKFVAIWNKIHYKSCKNWNHLIFVTTSRRHFLHDILREISCETHGVKKSWFFCASKVKKVVHLQQFFLNWRVYIRADVAFIKVCRGRALSVLCFVCNFEQFQSNDDFWTMVISRERTRHEWIWT